MPPIHTQYPMDLCLSCVVSTKRWLHGAEALQVTISGLLQCHYSPYHYNRCDRKEDGPFSLSTRINVCRFVPYNISHVICDIIVVWLQCDCKAVKLCVIFFLLPSQSCFFVVKFPWLSYFAVFLWSSWRHLAVKQPY